MPWQQLIIQAIPDKVDAISSLLSSLDAAAVTLSDNIVDGKEQPIFEPERGTTPLWDATLVTALFADNTDFDAIITQLTGLLGTAPIYTITPLEDQDWTRAWMDDFKPMQFGEHLWIIPSHHHDEQQHTDPDAVNIHLDPGLAFGTGTHPTTAMCLSWLDSHPPQNVTVLDYGCGSGILAIAAAKLGAKTVYAVDNDPQAIDATQANARQNHINDINTFLPADFAGEQADLQVDVLLANILAEPLLQLAPVFNSHCMPGSHVVLAGLLASQAAEIQQAYAQWCKLEIVAQTNDWVCLHGQCL